MEDTHGVDKLAAEVANEESVLILIIMEDTHGGIQGRLMLGFAVLILIIMEDTHGGCSSNLCEIHVRVS